MAAGGGNQGGVAFFEFGNNAQQNAEQIVRAMAAIQAAVNKPISKQQVLALDTGGMGTMLSRVEGELKRGQQRINSLMSEFGVGKINPQQMQDSYRKIVRSSLSAIPLAVADTISMTNPDVLKRVNLTGAARQWGQDFVRVFNQTLQSAGQGIAGFNYMPKDTTFAKDVAAVAQKPIGFGATFKDYDGRTRSQAGYQEVFNRAWLEEFIRQEVAGKLSRQQSNAIAQRLGIAEELKALRNGPNSIVQYDDGGKATGIQDTGIRSMLANLDRERRAALPAAHAQEKGYRSLLDARTRDTLAMYEQAEAQRLLNQVMRQKTGRAAAGAGTFEVGRGRVVEQTPVGPVVYKPTTTDAYGGYTQDVNRRSIAQATAEMQKQIDTVNKLTQEQRNYQYVQANGIKQGRDWITGFDARLPWDQQTGAQVWRRVAGTRDQMTRVSDDLGREQALRAYGNEIAKATGNLQQHNAALGTVNNGYIQLSRSLQADPTGAHFFKRTTTGAAPVMHPWDLQSANKMFTDMQVAEALKQQRLANYQHVLGSASMPIGRGGNPATWVTGYDPTQSALAQIQSARVFARVAGSTDQMDEITEPLRKASALQALEKQIIATDRAAQTASESEQRRQMLDAQRNSGFLGGMVGRLHRNELSPMANMGNQVMSAAIFSAAYGSIFALGAAVADTAREFMDYQDSVTDLEVATRSADLVTGDWINTLSQLSRLSGANMGQAMDTAARGVRAFTDPLVDAPRIIEAAGTATAEAATKLALIAQKDMKDATGDIISIASSYELDPDQFGQIVDAVSIAKRNMGGDPNQIAQGLSLIASTASEAGYSLMDAANMIGIVQAKTDQSGQAIATRMSRVYQIISGSTGKNLASEFGIDADRLSIKEQISAYGQIYTDPNTSDAQRDRILSALGGTANRREVLAVLKEGDRLARAYKDGMKHAGAGTDEFERKTNNLVGTLLKMKGTISNLQVDVARANLFAPFAILVKTLEPALQGLDLLVKAYDEAALAAGNVFGEGKEEIDRYSEAMQTLLAVMLNVALAAKAIAMWQSKGLLYTGTGSAAVNFANAATVQNQARLAAMFNTAGVAAAGISSTARPSRFNTTGTFAGGLGTIGRAVFSWPTAIIAAIVGGFAIAGKEWESARKREEMVAATTGSFSGAYNRMNADGAITSASIQQAAQDLRATAGEIKEMDPGWHNRDEQQFNVQVLQAEAKGLVMMARRVAEEERLAAGLRKTSVFGKGAIETVDQLAEGLDAIAESGGSALTQMQMLREALTTPPPQQKEYLRPDLLAMELREAFMATLEDSLPKEVKGYTDLAPKKDEFGSPRKTYAWNPSMKGPRPGTQEYAIANGGLLNDDGTPNWANRLRGGDIDDLSRETVYAQTAALNPLKMFDQMVQEELANMDLGDATYITAAQKAELATRLSKRLDMQQLTGDVDGIAQEWLKNTVEFLKENSMENMGADPALLNNPNKTPEMIHDILYGSESADGKTKYPGFVPVADAGLAAIPQNDDDQRQREAEIRANLAMYDSWAKELEGRGFAVPTELELLIKNAGTELANIQLERANDLREAAEAGAKTTRELRRIRVDQVKATLVNAVTGEFNPIMDQPEMLETLFEALDRQSIEAVLDYLDAQVVVKQAAVNHTLNLLSAARHLLTQGGVGASGGSAIQEGINSLLDELDVQEKDLSRSRNAAESARNTYENETTVTDENVKVDGKTDTKTDKDKLTQAQKDAMRWQASVDPDNTVEGAQAALAVAEANKEAAKGFQERNAAMQEVTAAQDALDKAIASHAGVAAQVVAAQTKSPLDAARAQITAASAMMAASAKGSDGYLQALAQFYQAQWAMREAVIQYQNNLDLLSGDMTDPVEQARDALAAAQRTLASDQANGAGADVIAADQVAVRQSQTALEKARWDQKLSDMKIAEQLGNISHAQYTRYLENESARMHKMHNKTRQQIDYMNQVDLELKNAKDAMDGMFNLGDINTKGLVYQARRWAAEQRAQRSQAAAERFATAVSNYQVSIQFDGADAAVVRRELEKWLGPLNGPARRTVARRKY